MPRMVHCVKLGKELEGLDRPPYPGDLGKRIFDSVSKEAWKQWMEYQTKVINEHRLIVFQPEAQKILQKHAQEFFFGEKLSS